MECRRLGSHSCGVDSDSIRCWASLLPDELRVSATPRSLDGNSRIFPGRTCDFGFGGLCLLGDVYSDLLVGTLAGLEVEVREDGSFNSRSLSRSHVVSAFQPLQPRCHLVIPGMRVDRRRQRAGFQKKEIAHSGPPLLLSTEV